VLSPVEIKKHEFGRAMRGYDQEEVNAFLESVAGEFEKLLDQVRLQSSEVERLRAELSSYQRMEQNMREAMVNAQETLRDAREGARREAELAQREAEVMAEKIIADARRRSEEIRREVDGLVQRRDGLTRKLRALLRSELDLIDLMMEEDEKIDQANGESPVSTPIKASPLERAESQILHRTIKS